MDKANNVHGPFLSMMGKQMVDCALQGSRLPEDEFKELHGVLDKAFGEGINHDLDANQRDDLIRESFAVSFVHPEWERSLSSALEDPTSHYAVKTIAAYVRAFNLVNQHLFTAKRYYLSETDTYAKLLSVANIRSKVRGEILNIELFKTGTLSVNDLDIILDEFPNNYFYSDYEGVVSALIEIAEQATNALSPHSSSDGRRDGGSGEDNLSPDGNSEGDSANDESTTDTFNQPHEIEVIGNILDYALFLGDGSWDDFFDENYACLDSLIGMVNQFPDGHRYVASKALPILTEVCDQDETVRRAIGRLPRTVLAACKLATDDPWDDNPWFYRAMRFNLSWQSISIRYMVCVCLVERPDHFRFKRRSVLPKELVLKLLDMLFVLYR